MADVTLTQREAEAMIHSARALKEVLRLAQGVVSPRDWALADISASYIVGLLDGKMKAAGNTCKECGCYQSDGGAA